MDEDGTLPLRKKIEDALAICRPYLLADGGDCEFVSAKDGVVEVRFTGTCAICALSRMTLRAGIERAIMRFAPEIKRVEAVTVAE